MYLYKIAVIDALKTERDDNYANIFYVVTNIMDVYIYIYITSVSMDVYKII